MPGPNPEPVSGSEINDKAGSGKKYFVSATLDRRNMIQINKGVGRKDSRKNTQGNAKKTRKKRRGRLETRKQC
jgi:hypothetical protein